MTRQEAIEQTIRNVFGSPGFTDAEALEVVVRHPEMLPWYMPEIRAEVRMITQQSK